MGTTNVGTGASAGTRGSGRITAAAFAALIVGGFAIAAGGCKKTPPPDQANQTGAVDPPGATPAGAVAADPTVAKHPPRRLEDVNRHELETTLPKGVPVEITAPKGDDEAFMLAQQIRAFLHSEKYPVGNVLERDPDPSAKGVGLESLPDGKWRVIVGSAD